MVIDTIFLTALITSVTAIPSKRGLIIINSAHLQNDLPKYLASPQLQWVYNYSPQPSPNDAYGKLSFVPMLWGQDGSSTFLSTLKSGQRYDHVLSFNEPDMNKSVGGSDLSVDQAVSIWQTQINPLKTLGYKLGSPAGIISSNLTTDLYVVASTPAGTIWLSSFFSRCKNCTIDFVAAHFYGPSNALQSYLSELHANYSSLPIWLTEFGFPQESTNQVISSLNQTITFLDDSEWIERYAYFGAFRQGDGNSYIGQNGAVWDGNGDITEVGKMWLGLNETPNVSGIKSGVAQKTVSCGILLFSILIGVFSW